MDNKDTTKAAINKKEPIMKSIKYIIIILLLLIVGLITNTFLHSSKQIIATEVSSSIVSDSVFLHLSKAIQLPTVSSSPDSIYQKKLTAFQSFLETTYPTVFNTLTCIEATKPSLLFRWEGCDKSKAPIVLCAHQDVVPAGDTLLWSHPPFSGTIDNEFIWGRGSLDDKGSLISLLEALKTLITENKTPLQDIYIAFGHDEEVGGIEGAKQIALWMATNTIAPSCVYDEGLAVTYGMIPGLKQPAALIGTSEKGYLSVKIEANLEGGHSSTPASRNSISVLNNALSTILKNQPKPQITKPVEDFIDFIGPELPFMQRVIFANRWLFRDLIANIYTKKPASNALVRTTTAPTIINAGTVDNAIPTSASAIINFRLLPGDSSQMVINRLKNEVNDTAITITPYGIIREASKVSPSDTEGFKALQRSINSAFGNDVVVSPALMIASSDGRHYASVCENIYRFAPIEVTSVDMKRIHGINERIGKENLKKAVIFYRELLSNYLK